VDVVSSAVCKYLDIILFYTQGNKEFLFVGLQEWAVDVGREHYFVERTQEPENVESVGNDFVLDICRQDIEGLINIEDWLIGNAGRSFHFRSSFVHVYQVFYRRGGI